MASSPENVRLDMDNATDTTESSSHPLPPYPSPHPHSFHPPPAQPQWPLPSYPSAPPPEYGQAVGGKAYEASSATGPYLYTTSQANQPQQIFLPPYSQVNDSQAQQFVLIDGSPMRSGQSQPSFLAHFMLSCCVFWCCGWMCGGIAFIVALIAQNSAASGDVKGARRLGYVSLGLSICGLIIGAIVTIVVIAEAAQ